jgi:hypothetical protein
MGFVQNESGERHELEKGQPENRPSQNDTLKIGWLPDKATTSQFN